MSGLALRVEGLSKRYRIGEPMRYHTLRDALSRPLGRLTRRRASHGALPSRPPRDHVWALRDVSFEVPTGQVLGLIGPNGAGKTTLLRLLGRITRPTRGYAEVRGRVGALLEVGTGFSPELTGRDNVYLSGAVLGMKRADIRRQFDEIVAFAEVERFIDTPVKHYSSGMYVRLAFAVAAHLDPDILLVDEVLAVGDVAFQAKCLGKMHDVVKGGRTVLFVSHNIGVITRLCERCLLFTEGQLVMDGTASQVAERYQSAHLQPHAHWKAESPRPATTGLAFVDATVVDARHTERSVFRADEPIGVEIVYEVVRPISACQLSIWFCNAVGTQVLCTADTDAHKVPALPRAPGVYRTRVALPAPLLAVGRYTVGLSAHMPGVLPYDEVRDAMTFEVSPLGSLESFDSRKPVVAPLLSWDTHREN